MARLYADKFNGNHIKITQQIGAPKAAALAGLDQLLLILPERISSKTWAGLPESQTLKRLMRRRVKGQVPAVSTRLRNKRGTAVHIGTANPNDAAFSRLTFARQLVSAVRREKSGTVGIWVAGFGDEDEARLVENVAAAALAASFVLATFKEETPPAPLRSIKVIGLSQRLDLTRTQAEAEGNNLARWLTALPANKLDATEYATLLKHIAGENGWQYTRYSVSDLKKKGAGAFLAVAQGNADDSACIIRLRYRPGAKSAKPTLSLVGKGIIFDTGGTNLKPFASMLDMHIDMGGSAVAVGSLLTISKLGLDMPVDCWLAITENRTGPTAYKSQDVVTAANGKTIQTIHTDAEGRMALADTLVFACAEEPAAIIDYATLTGACMNAVTTRYSGAFTNSPELHPALKKAGTESGERIWPFPIGKEFVEELKSETADIRQCSPEAGGDHILAASFLNEFVDESVPWVHIDLSAAQRKGGLAHVPTDITGFGVRFTMNLLLDRGLLDQKAGS